MFGLSKIRMSRGFQFMGYPSPHPVMDAHDLVLKPMVTWGSPIKTGAWRIWQRLHPGILSEPLQGGEMLKPDTLCLLLYFNMFKHRVFFNLHKTL